ncbi:MAG: barstar family protein [Bacteroidota bacterium]
MIQLVSSAEDFATAKAQAIASDGFRDHDQFTRIDANACPDKPALFTTFAGALPFPDHFANNWDSFADCLQDVVMTAQTNQLVFLADYPALLAQAEKDRNIFEDILADLTELKPSKLVTIITQI